jgi:CelD/BcsL family acetyltransferase involved in cellulose biosynthesis
VSRVEVIRADALDAELERTWIALQAADSDLSSPFFSPAFAKIVAGVRDDVRIAVISDAGEPVGFFPHHRQPFGRLAPLAGQISDYHGIIGARDVFDPLELLRALEAQVFDFNHVPASQAGFSAHAFLHTTSPVVDLSEGFESWRQDKRGQGSAIKNVERKGRKLGREVGELRFVADDRSPDAWTQLLAWKREALAAIEVGFILDQPWAGTVVDRVRTMDTPGFGGMTSALWAGDTLAAVTLSIRTGDTIHSWFPTYNPGLERYSPGLTLLMETLRHASAAGFREVDLGRGSERYKKEFANNARPLCEGSVERSFSPLGCTRRLRKVAQAAVARRGTPEQAELARRAGNRLLAAGRLS